ncbi:MAG: hypothetical protein E6J82_18070 [Deltaproteobacteria bacterium]|nr:MAG: hypothetical protein E6J82_18070 [Deltaproteobacteria bacterium]
MDTWYERLSTLDSLFLEIEDRSAHMHVGAVAHRSATRPGAALPSTRAVRSFQTGPAGLDRRVAVRPRVPRAPHRSAGAGRRSRVEEAGRPLVLAGARSGQAALGDVAGGGPGRIALRHRQQDAPLHARRDLRRRPRHGADGSKAGKRSTSEASVLATQKGSQAGGAALQLGERAALQSAAHGERSAGTEQRGREARHPALQWVQALRRRGVDGPRAGVAAERGQWTFRSPK